MSGSIFNDIFIFAHTQRLKKRKDKKLRSHTEDKVASFPLVSAFAKRVCILVCGHTEVAITPEAGHLFTFADGAVPSWASWLANWRTKMKHADSFVDVDGV